MHQRHQVGAVALMGGLVGKQRVALEHGLESCTSVAGLVS